MGEDGIISFMNLESEFGIDARKAAAIAGLFRRPDEQRRKGDSYAFTRALHKYLKEFGPVNFAVLETVFRDNNFSTHFLAVPARMVEISNPYIQVVDMYDMVINKKVTLKPFVAVRYTGLQGVQSAARGHGLAYNQERNLMHLHNAGVYSPLPGYKLTGDPFTISVRPLGMN